MSKKKQTREKKTSIEDIYRNKHFVPPKEQNLETIFEEPRKSKDGVPILTSVKKYKRYLHFDPTQNKIQKRKRKAKKCLKKLKSSGRTTRSSPKNSKCDDVSLYIFNVLGDSSDDSDMDISSTRYKKSLTGTFPIADAGESSTIEACSANSARDLPCSDSCDTPKRVTCDESRSRKVQKLENDSEEAILNDKPDLNVTITYDDTEKSNIKSDVDETLESPRRSCCIS